MRSLKLVSFYAMRMRRVVPVVCAVMLVVMLGTLISLNALTEKVTQYDLDGAQLVAREVNANVNFGFDYIGAFTVLAWAIALAIATSERRLLASMGASNWEWLLSLVLYSALQAVVFTLFSVLLGALGRSAMMLMGMEASAPWSAQLIFTGGRENFWQDCLYGAANMLRMCAGAALLAVVFKRWWKPILIVFGAGIVTMVVLVIQVDVSSYASQIVYWIEQFIRFLENSVLPALEAYYSNTTFGARLGREFLDALVLFALCYPATWHMKNA